MSSLTPQIPLEATPSLPDVDALLTPVDQMIPPVVIPEAAQSRAAEVASAVADHLRTAVHLPNELALRAMTSWQSREPGAILAHLGPIGDILHSAGIFVERIGGIAATVKLFQLGQTAVRGVLTARGYLAPSTQHTSLVVDAVELFAGNAKPTDATAHAAADSIAHAHGDAFATGNHATAHDALLDITANKPDTSRVAEAHNPWSGRAANLTDWSRQDLEASLRAQGVPEAQIQKIIHDDHSVNPILAAYERQNHDALRSRNSNPTNWIYAGESYQTSDAKATSDQVAAAIAQKLGIHVSNPGGDNHQPGGGGPSGGPGQPGGGSGGPDGTPTNQPTAPPTHDGSPSAPPTHAPNSPEPTQSPSPAPSVDPGMGTGTPAPSPTEGLHPTPENEGDRVNTMLLLLAGAILTTTVIYAGTTVRQIKKSGGRIRPLPEYDTDGEKQTVMRKIRRFIRRWRAERKKGYTRRQLSRDQLPHHTRASLPSARSEVALNALDDLFDGDTGLAWWDVGGGPRRRTQWGNGDGVLRERPWAPRRRAVRREIRAERQEKRRIQRQPEPPPQTARRSPPPRNATPTPDSALPEVIRAPAGYDHGRPRGETPAPTFGRRGRGNRAATEAARAAVPEVDTNRPFGPGSTPEDLEERRRRQAGGS